MKKIVFLSALLFALIGCQQKQAPKQETAPAPAAGTPAAPTTAAPAPAPSAPAAPAEKK